jgi:putative intracellular protease/amidase
MRKICIFMMMVIIVCGLLFPLQTVGQSSRKVLLIPREGLSGDLDMAIKMEANVIINLLKEAGFQVDVATLSGEPIVGPFEKIENVQKLSNLKTDDYAGTILVCMAMGLATPVSPEVVAVVKKALAEGKPVAATANASAILAEAGLLKGKKYARSSDPLAEPKSGSSAMPDSRYEGGIYSGKGVVKDGKIITSGACPTMAAYFTGMNDGTTEITQKFIAAIGSK